MSSQPQGSREFRDISDLVIDIARSTDRGRRKRLRDRLKELPRADVTALLALELSECANANRFERLANTLAKVGGAEAMDILARHARTQRRFPGLAIHALSRCADERVLPLLMDLAEFGRHAQRISSIRALGRMKEVRSIELLCGLSRANGQAIGYIAAEALKRKGGYDALPTAILMNAEMGIESKLRGLRALETTTLGWRSFKAERALEKIARNPRNPLRDEASAALELMRAQAVLLRASATVPDAALLRSSGAGEIDSSTLLRGSEPLRLPAPSRGPRRIFSVFRRFLKRV